jgi:hypothetical protein
MRRELYKVGVDALRHCNLRNRGAGALAVGQNLGVPLGAALLEMRWLRLAID